MNAVVIAGLLAAFRFSQPEGWTDLSRCPDEATLKALPEDVRTDAERICSTNDGGITFAVDLRHVDENAVASFNAVVLSGAPVVDEAAAKKMADGFVDVAARKGEKLDVVEAKAVALSGQPGAQLRFLRTYRSDRMDVFIVPHQGSTAMLTFIAPISRYEEYEPIFSSVANSVVAPEEMTPQLKIIAFVSVLFGAAVGFFVFVARKRRRRKS